MDIEKGLNELSGIGISKDEKLVVAVRCRPANAQQGQQCIEIDEKTQSLLIKDPNGDQEKSFAYDYLYGSASTQVQLYNDLGVPILNQALAGFHSTMFAYGQTGSGKTYTMTGDASSPGLIPRLGEDLFRKISTLENDKHKFLVVCSFFEIYNEFIYDLLDGNNKTKLQIKEHPAMGVYVNGLRSICCSSHDKLAQLIEQGQKQRTQGETDMNAKSSRSHAIFSITVHQKLQENKKNLFAKINLVDLAGSERASRTGSLKQGKESSKRLKEGSNINKSLTALGVVINTLAKVAESTSKKKLFIPYRNSKLTRILQQSLGGNSKCSMLATVSPGAENYNETLCTLLYADRAKSIKVNARRNEESDMMDKLKEEVASLKSKLERDPSSHREEYEQQIKEMNEIMKQTWEDKERLSKKHELELRLLDEQVEQSRIEVEAERKRMKLLLQEKQDPEMTVRNYITQFPFQPRWLDMIMKIRTVREDYRRQLLTTSIHCKTLEGDRSHWAEIEVENDKANRYGAEFLPFLKSFQRKLQAMVKEYEKLEYIENRVEDMVSRLRLDIKSCYSLEQIAEMNAKDTAKSVKELQAPTVTLLQEVVKELGLFFDESEEHAWLNHVVNFVATTLAENFVRADPNSIASGRDPLATNHLLRGLVTVAQRPIDNAIINKDIKRSYTPCDLEALRMLDSHINAEHQNSLENFKQELNLCRTVEKINKCLIFSLSRAAKLAKDDLMKEGLQTCLGDLNSTAALEIGHVIVGVSGLLEFVQQESQYSVKAESNGKVELQMELLHERQRSAELEKLLEESLQQNAQADVKLAKFEVDLASALKEKTDVEGRVQGTELLETQITELEDEIVVLVEERDIARSKEEEYYSEVVEIKDEMERLKEGYCWATDLLNEKRDEIHELNERLEQWEQTKNVLTKPETSRVQIDAEHDLMYKTLQKLYSLEKHEDEETEPLSISEICAILGNKRNQPIIKTKLEDARNYAEQLLSPKYDSEYDNDFEDDEN